MTDEAMQHSDDKSNADNPVADTPPQSSSLAGMFFVFNNFVWLLYPNLFNRCMLTFYFFLCFMFLAADELSGSHWIC